MLTCYFKLSNLLFMKKGILTVTILMSLFVCFTASAQSDSAAMKKWMESMMPGEMQSNLASNEGEWSTETTLWLNPSAPPVTSKGACVNKMILGGRYLESRHTGTVMNMPFEGIGTYGFDNVKKVFVVSWIDNMGTGIMHMEGTWDDATQSVTFRGTQADPFTGATVDMMEVHKIIDSNNQLMEMFVVQNSHEIKTMQVKYVRK